MQDLPEPEAETWKGYALAATAAAFWATGGLVAKWLFTPLNEASAAWPFPPAGIDVDPVVLSGARALTAAVIMVVYLLISRPEKLRVRPRDFPFLALFGAGALAGVHVSYFKAISYTNVATAILLEYLAPVIVLVFSVLFLSEKLTWELPVGVMFSVGGCALVVGAVGGDGLAVSVQGVWWGLTAAGFFALYQLLGKWAAPRFSPWTLLAYGFAAATVFWIIYLRGFAEIIDLMSTFAGASAVVYIAVFSTIVPFGASLKALHYIDATKAVVTSTLEPAIAGAAAWVLLAESFGAWQLVGAGMVIVAIFVVQRPGRKVMMLPPGT